MTDAIAAARQALQSGDLARAEALATAARADPALALDAIEVLALAAKVRGDGTGHQALLREAITLAPTRAWPRNDLAESLHASGRLAEAEAILRETLAVQPENPDAHMRLGNLLSEREELVEGEEHLRAAIAIVGPHPQLVANLGRNLQRQGRLEPAAPLLADAVRAMPEALAPLAWLAELEEQAGRFDRAAALLDRAEPIARKQGSDVTLQRATLLARTDDWRRGLTMLEAERSLSGAALLLRGRLRDRAGREAEAWSDFSSGKSALGRASGRSYRAETVGTLIAQWRTAFSPGDFATFTPAALRDEVPQPIFILGFPRSGTTLTEQILVSHAQVRAGGELAFGRELAEMATDWTRGALPARPEAVTPDLRAMLALRLRDHYLARAERYRLLKSGARFFTDKMPLNELYLPLLRLAFPASPVVVVTRDPRDIVVSAMSHDFTHGFNCGYRLDDIALHLARMSALTGHWLESLAVPACHLRYENLVADQIGTTSALMAHLGLAMEPAQLAFHTLVRHAPTPSYAQVKQPLNDRSVGRWHRYARELAPVLPILADAIARGGYAADSPAAKAAADGPTIS